MENRAGGRLALLLPAGFAMLAGLDAALVLLGLPAPVEAARLPSVHGMLMVLGFVGTLVALERAVAVGRWWCFAAPVGLGLGGIALVTPLPLAVGRTALLVGAAAFVAVYLAIWRRQAAAAVAVQATGAVLAVGAAALWLAGVDVPPLTPWLAGFLVLTVVGERLELMRIVPLPRWAPDALVGAACGVLGGAALGLLWPAVGVPVVGAALLVAVGVLARFDVATRTVRSTGLPRFMGAAMLAGFAWLAVAGALWLVGGPVLDGTGYDAVLHAVFLGFVMSMVMAHAPVILPAVLRRPLPYRAAMWVPLAVLHATLVLRLLVGDAWGVPVAVQVGGVGNIVAVLGFFGVAVTSVLLGRRPAPARTASSVADAPAGPPGAPVTTLASPASAPTSSAVAR